jgi:hypothetical protein
MAGKIQKIIEDVKMPETVQEGIKEALEKQDAIDQIQTTDHRAIDYLEIKRTIKTGRDEIEKKIEKEHRRKFLESQEDKSLVEQRLRDEGRGGNKTLGVVEAEELRNVMTKNVPQKELTEEERQRHIIDYLDEVMQLPEFWTGNMEKQDEKPQKEEIELLERRAYEGIRGYLIRNKTTGKKFFVPDLQNLNRNVADKLPSAIKISFKRYNIS